jgi:hypothetical protein
MLQPAEDLLDHPGPDSRARDIYRPLSVQELMRLEEEAPRSIFMLPHR